MECENKRITLSVYWDGEISKEEKRKVEEHLKGCPLCRKELVKIQRLSSIVKEVPGIKVTPQFEDKLKEKLTIVPEMDMLNITIEDSSAYLQVPVEAIWASLLEIPSFSGCRAIKISEREYQ